MKKYRLIKEYPGSPILGTINGFKSGNTLKLDIVKNYPEYWEEVVEKDYEILSLVASEKHPQHKKGSKFLHNKDYKFKNMHPTEFWDIYSVKRISDNKIFTIGDFYEDLIIEKMFMSVDDNILTTYKPKIKEPIFQTEDGVEIFKGDDYYHTDIEWRIYKSTNAKINSGNLIGVKGYNYFSTKEKAEEYILMNKPCLSVNDLYAMGNWSYGGKIITDMKNLAKQKLK